MDEPTEVKPLDAAAPQFRDRSTGLLIFGILEILLGVFCALLAVLMPLLQNMAGQAGGGTGSFPMAISTVLVYGLSAAVFVWLGIGSIRCRRWARALILISAWTWVAIGVISMIFACTILPQVLETPQPGGPAIPPEFGAVIMTVTLVMLAVLYVILPGVVALFYGSPDVKATCEARDPKPCWTDACPLPVLGLSMWLGVMPFGLLWMLIAYNGVVPCFGVLLSGTAGSLAVLLQAAVWSWLAWATYRRQPAAWWLSLAALLLMSASNLVTFTTVPLMEMYERMGFSGEQLAMMRSYGFLQNTIWWWTLVFTAFAAGYMLWVKKYFSATR